MSRSISQKRPWLAAVLAAIVTGLGHLYLRRWRRALGWLVLVFATGTLFVEPAAMQALANGNAFDPVELAPILLVGGLSVVDAYLIARAQNRRGQTVDEVLGEGDSTEAAYCPHCGKEIDTELDFCQWCSASLDDVEF